jgi:hypothetical protein
MDVHTGGGRGRVVGKGERRRDRESEIGRGNDELNNSLLIHTVPFKPANGEQYL